MIQTKSRKNTISELAIFGGDAMFAKPLVVGAPNIPDVETLIGDLRQIFANGTLSNNGPYVRRFEAELCKVTKAAHCIATCNGTIALEIVARALGLTGEVLVPSFTFIATAHALSWQGLKPVFVDVDPLTHTIDPKSVVAAITPSTSSICGVHLWGNVCDVEALQDIADQHRLALWFDASHAFAVRGQRKMVGNFGRAEVFSFHATKYVNAFEGGAIATNDASLAQTMREIRNFGFAENRDREVVNFGTNGKMSEVSAAMGLRSLELHGQTRIRNRQDALKYGELLSSFPGIQIHAPLDVNTSNCQYVVVQIDMMQTGISRDDIMKTLWAEGILTQRYFYPGCHKALPYQEQSLRHWVPLPVTEELAQSVLVLPTGMGTNEHDIERVCELLRFVIQNGGKIQSALAGREDSV